MNVYKLRHKPTGLFFTPSKGRSNLSIKGKIYSTKPKIEWCKCLRIVIFNDKKLSEKDNLIIEYFKIITAEKYIIDTHVYTNELEWEIIQL